MSLIDNEPPFGHRDRRGADRRAGAGRAPSSPVACWRASTSMGVVLMRGLVKRLRQADGQIESLALLDVYGRVARAH